MAHEDRIRKNYSLICLDGGAELPFELPELVWQDEGLTTTQVLQKCGVK